MTPHPRLLPILRLLVVGLVAACLAACSAVRIAYNQAPDLTYWWLDSYLDLTDAQSPRMRDDLGKFFAWHRATELPKTADWLAQAAQLAGGEINAPQACRLLEQARGLLDTAAEQALPALADLAPTLTPAQIAHLQRKFAKNTDEFRRDYIQATPSSRDALRLKRSVDRSETFYGRLEEAQLAVIRQVVAESVFDAQVSLKERERRQRDFAEVLMNLVGARASAATSQHALRLVLQRVWDSPDPAYRTYQQRSLSQACQAFARIHASTTPAQRAQAVRVLKGYEADLRSLASQR